MKTSVKKVRYLKKEIKNKKGLKDDSHLPVVLLEKSVANSSGGFTSIYHCAVMKENTIHGSGDSRFIKIKNSSDEEPELEIKLNMTANENGWKFDSPDCIYIKLD